MHVLGIDIAKQTFEVTLLHPDETAHHATFANTAEGFIALRTWLTDHDVQTLHACMEATNVYWEALAETLYTWGSTVSVVNPVQIKGFAIAQLQRNKTDKLDGHTIAQFCASQRPAAWQPMSAAQQQLRALVRHREDLIQTKLQQQNRLRDTRDAVIRASLEAVLATVLAQLDAMERAIATHLKSHEELRTNATLLQTITGIGLITAATLLAELAAITQYASAKALAADVGVTPMQHESGSSVRRRSRMSKLGKADLRAALWWPAITAMQRCPAIQAFANRLASRGKPNKVVLGAVMRKLLHIVYGVLKHQTPYDPRKVSG